MDVWVVLAWGHRELAAVDPWVQGLCVDTPSFSGLLFHFSQRSPIGLLPDVGCSGGTEAQILASEEQQEGHGILVAAVPDPETSGPRLPPGPRPREVGSFSCLPWPPCLAHQAHAVCADKASDLAA